MLKTRTAWHNIKHTKTLCREVFCDYDLDGVMKFHSLHNTKVRATDAGKLSASPYNSRYPPGAVCIKLHAPTVSSERD